MTSLIEVPDIVLNFPLVPRLLPNGDVFACKWLRIIAGGLASKFANFAQIAVAEGFDVDGGNHEIRSTLNVLDPERFDRIAALYHLAARRKNTGILGICFAYRLGITFFVSCCQLFSGRIK